MNGRNILGWFVVGMALLAASLLTPAAVLAHCDGMDGPVVKAAQKALAEGKVNLALIWVQPADEGAIRTAFQKALAVRKLGPEARELADTYFFETLVRIHRAGEGAPYTGLKPADRDLGPIIPAADRAIADGKVESLLKLLPPAAHTGIRRHFDEVLAKKDYSYDDVSAGRAYVAAYVAFMHTAEGVHEGGNGDAATQHHQDGKSPGHHETETHERKPSARPEDAGPSCPLHGGPKEVHRETHEHPGQ